MTVPLASVVDFSWAWAERIKGVSVRMSIGIFMVCRCVVLCGYSFNTAQWGSFVKFFLDGEERGGFVRVFF